MELAELVSDRDFRQRVRQVVDYGRPRDADERLRNQGDWVTENAVAAVLRGCPPYSAEAAQVVNRIWSTPGGSLRREELLAGLELVAERRMDRYAGWELPARLRAAGSGT
jgi:hypothetical protein